MRPFDLEFLSRNGFSQSIRIGDYENDPKAMRSIPDVKGLYIVISPELPEKEFLNVGTGGFFKGINPNVIIEKLLDNWVEDTHILYIGKAGGRDAKGKTSNATLRDRITAYLSFGYGHRVGH